jgi:hypothetical protein
LQRKVHPEQQRRRQVGGNASAQAADERTASEREIGEDEYATTTPPVGQDARGNLEERHDRGVCGGEQADRGGGKPDLAEEQLLDRHPEVDAQQPRRDIQRAKAPADSGA